MAKDFNKILLGEGLLTYNAGAGDIELGFTRGGVFNDNINVRHVEVDGKPGNTKGDAIIDEASPTLEFAMVQMEADNLDKIFANVTVADAAGIKTLTRSIGVVAATEYLDNITYVGKTMEGKDITIILKNALGEGPVNLTFADKSEVEVPALFTGNYATADDTDMPYEIIIDES